MHRVYHDLEKALAIFKLELLAIEVRLTLIAKLVNLFMHHKLSLLLAHLFE